MCACMQGNKVSRATCLAADQLRRVRFEKTSRQHNPQKEQILSEEWNFKVTKISISHK